MDLTYNEYKITTNTEIMGQIVIIRLKTKDDHEIIKINKLCKKAGIKSFTTEQDNIAWHKDINSNPKSPQRHLKPITLEKLKLMFSFWCEVGALSFDVAFSRTSQAEAKRYAKFILKHANLIKELQGAQSMLERYKFTIKEQEAITKLNVILPAPKKLPVDLRTKRNLQGGLMLCKSWGLQPFWVIFGKVKDDYPVFLKDRQYEDENYNNIYRDDSGYAYLLLPLLPLDNNQLDFVEKVYSNAWSMGLRESFNLFIPFVYGLDITNIDKVADDYKESYTVEELKERFYFVFKATESIFPYNNVNGFVWRDDKLAFVPCGTSTPITQVWAKCHILTAILRAVGPEISAEIMSKLLNKKYSKFEFTK
jgi:hypothetical protein